jgi:hypothetical protein
LTSFISGHNTGSSLTAAQRTALSQWMKSGSTTPSVTPTATPTPTAPVPTIVHTTAGYTDCVACHGTTSFRPYPTSHAGRTNSSCATCHQTSGSTSAPRLSVGAPTIDHSLSNRQDCRSCHGTEESLPRSHSAYQSITCQVCHRT